MNQFLAHWKTRSTDSKQYQDLVSNASLEWGGGGFFRSMQDNSNSNGLDLSSVPKQPEGKAPLLFQDFHNGFHIKGGITCQAGIWNL